MAGASVASKKAKAKGAGGRKVKDKWKAKEWYTIHAPQMFNGTVVGETPSADPENLIGRTTEVTVQDLNGDFSKMHIKLKFQITEVDGHDAKTDFVGHEFTSEYVRRLTRRKKTKTDNVVDVVTADGYGLRVKTFSIAESRVQSSQEVAMRQIITATLKQIASEKTISQFVKDIVSNDLSKDLAKACKVIIPIKRVEVRKTEVLVRGEGEPDVIEDFVEEPAAEEEPAEETSEEPATEEEAPAEAPAEEASE